MKTNELQEWIEKQVELDWKPNNMQEALLFGIYRHFMPEIPEPQPEKVLTSEEQEEQDLREEFKVVSEQLKNDYNRKNGGNIVIGGKKFEVPTLSKEIEQLQEAVELLRIQIKYFFPLTPYWKFETNIRWRQLKLREFEAELQQKEITLSNVLKQQEDIEKRIPETQQRKDEIIRKMEEWQKNKEVKISPA